MRIGFLMDPLDTTQLDFAVDRAGLRARAAAGM